MDIKYIEKYEVDEFLRIIDYWESSARYDFEIAWDEKKEDIESIEKEFKLNVKNQFENYFLKFNF